MTTKTYAFLTVLGVGLSMACNQKGTPPPQFNMGMESDGTKLPPIRLVKRDKNSLIGSASSAGSTATETPVDGAVAPTTPAAGAVTIDDSSAEAVAESFVSVMKECSFSQLPDIVVPEQAEVARQMAAAIQPMIEAVSELSKALEDKIPDHGIKLPGTAEMVRGLLRDVSITDIKAIDDDNAEGVFHTQVNGNEQTKPIKFKRINEKWRVDPPTDGTPSPEQLEQTTALTSKLAEALKEVAKKVNDGEITDANGVKENLAKSVMALLSESGMGVPTAPDGSAEPAAPPPIQQGTPPSLPGPDAGPKPRERDEVDSTYVGPGQLRAK